MTSSATLWGPSASTEKIQPRHRERAAYIYIRQSSPKQVQENREGLRNQYALAERAQALGWIPARVHVIDADLGHSGRERERRGFQELVSAVSLGHVGIVLAYEASRLARNNADWYELLDLAALVGALIADAEAVYDPRSYNDRLLLGLRGLLSEAELHLLRLRLDAGRLRQVAAGTFRHHLPTGLVRLPTGRVIKDPDQQVQRTLALVFERFGTLGSVQRVVRSLHADAILLPRRQTGGLQAGEMLWRLPSASAVRAMLHNPAYAGAFAYGRKGPAPELRAGRPHIIHRPLEEWTALRHDVYPAYIDWETYMANQERLANNRYHFARRAQGAPRSGAGLLAGLAVCGRCGHQMQVRYKPALRYLCVARRESHALDSCLHLDGRSIEAAVVAAFFEAIQPAELDLLDEALASVEAERSQRAQHHADQIKRAEYEARLAEKQYRLVDPENRLVAAELEHRWELALRALAEARDVAQRFAQMPVAPVLDPALRRQLHDVGAHLPALWASGRLRPEQQKELLRSLIRRVVLTRPEPETVEVTIVWVSGALSRLSVRPPLNRSVNLREYAQIVARVGELSAQGYTDREIAQRLSADGLHSAHRVALPLSLVRAIRAAQGYRSFYAQLREEGYIDGYWTVGGLARQLGVARRWVQWQITTGRLPAQQHPLTKHHLIPDNPDLIAHLRMQIPTHTLSEEGN
jgi:DNA invertase Pin-like site-specific DNA recombinase